MSNRKLHPRALIRHAIVRVIKKNEAIATLVGERVFPNRVEHWQPDELPAIGVYTLNESRLESDMNPDPEERRISLVVESLTEQDEYVDDRLDELVLVVEEALCIDAIGRAMVEIFEEGRKYAAGDPDLPPLPPGPDNRHPVDSMLLELRLQDTSLVLVVDEADNQCGLAALNFDLDYKALRLPIPMADFLIAYTAWDVAPADKNIDMESRVDFPPPNKGE